MSNPRQKGSASPTLEDLARLSDYRLGLERAAHECEWMARGYAAHLMQPLLDAAKRIRELPDDPRGDVAQRRDGQVPALLASDVVAVPREALDKVREIAREQSATTATEAADRFQRLAREALALLSSNTGGSNVG